jgi:hypothetical protein
LSVGEECLIVNALQAFVKEKQTINKEREKTKNNRDKYMKWLNEMYDIGLSAAHTPKDYQDAIQENDENFITPI